MSEISDIVEALVHVLRQDLQVSTRVQDRVFPDIAPDARRPCIVYSVIDDVEDEHLLGLAHLTQTRLQVTAWADRLLEARQLARAIRRALVRMHGAYGDISVQRVRPTGRPATFEPPASGGSAGVYGVQADYIAAWHEPAEEGV